MKIIVSKTNDPFYNIASEEYILKNFNEDIFFLYINKPSVICGKHQNPIAETNFDFIQKNNIPVIRRLSGGGTVYHDLGNLNFCFIQYSNDQKLVDFKRYTKPIMEVLNSLGLNASLGIKNDIRVDDIKISGNAEHIWKNRVLHHGTLLFDTNLSNLNLSLSKDDSNFIGKSVKSNRSDVTNILNHLIYPISIIDFRDKIAKYIKESMSDAKEYSFSAEDENSINLLSENKYSTWKWNYAYTSEYICKGKITIDLNAFEVEIYVKNGIIESIKGTSESKIIKELVGKPHLEILNRLTIK